MIIIHSLLVGPFKRSNSLKSFPSVGILDELVDFLVTVIFVVKLARQLPVLER